MSLSSFVVFPPPVPPFFSRNEICKVHGTSLVFFANIDSEAEMMDTEASHHKLSHRSSSIEGGDCSGRGLSKEAKAVEDLVFFSH